MYARIQTVRTLPEKFNTPGAARYLIDAVCNQPGFRSIHLMLQIGSRRGLNLTQWETLEDAVAAPDRTAAVLGPRPFPLECDEVYRVLGTVDGPSPAGEARVCQISWFDGPRSAAENEAMRRGGEERIAPAIAAVPGLVASLFLCHPVDSSVAIVTLATSTDALDQIVDAVYRTALLPDEDPALLTGPDRVEVFKVENQRLASVPVA